MLNRTCRSCGANGKDHIFHYSGHEQEACPEISRRAQKLELLEHDEKLTPRILLGNDDLDKPEVHRKWAFFLHSIWKKVDWIRRDGFSHYLRSSERRGRSWQED